MSAGTVINPLRMRRRVTVVCRCVCVCVINKVITTHTCIPIKKNIVCNGIEAIVTLQLGQTKPITLNSNRPSPVRPSEMEERI